MKVHLETLGCKLNESELEAWTRQFAEEGNEIVANPADADICVLNTCTVTAQAARKSRNIARQLARANPNTRLVLTGCYASTELQRARGLPNVALVVPNAEKDRLVDLTRESLPMAECAASAIQSPVFQNSSLGALHSALRTRAFVKIQDGCNMSCTYCVIPLARGKERSRPVREIVSEVQSLVDAGYKEIVLTGVQISEYRIPPRTSLRGRVVGAVDEVERRDAVRQPPLVRGVGGIGLRDLISIILLETRVPRLRLTSIAPWDLDESLLDLFSDPRLCRHLHLSLQSGSDPVLRRMRRPYSTEQFARAVERARAKIPDLAITTDVIVGFPGESDEAFEESLRFVEAMQFARVHVFPYSPRAGTIAAGLPHPVSDATKEARGKQMQGVAEDAGRRFASRFIGRTMEVLWETPEQGSCSGYTDNYVRVITQGEVPLHNRIAPARLNQVIGDGAIAATLPGGYSC